MQSSCENSYLRKKERKLEEVFGTVIDIDIALKL